MQSELKTDLINAISYKLEFPIIREIINKIEDVNFGNSISMNNGNPLLLLPTCAHSDSHKILKLLLDKGANVEIRDRFGMTPLKLFGQYSNYKCFKMLIDHGADTNEVKKMPFTDSNIIKLLKMDLNLLDDFDIDYFVGRKSANEIIIYLKYGSNYDPFKILKNILSYDNCSKYDSVLEYFHSINMNIPKFKDEFVQYAENNKVTVLFLKNMLKHKIPVNMRKISLLDDCATPKIVNLLLDYIGQENATVDSAQFSTLKLDLVICKKLLKYKKESLARKEFDCENKIAQLESLLGNQKETFDIKESEYKKKIIQLESLLKNHEDLINNLLH